MQIQLIAGEAVAVFINTHIALGNRAFIALAVFQVVGFDQHIGAAQAHAATHHYAFTGNAAQIVSFYKNQAWLRGRLAGQRALLNTAELCIRLQGHAIQRLIVCQGTSVRHASAQKCRSPSNRFARAGTKFAVGAGKAWHGRGNHMEAALNFGSYRPNLHKALIIHDRQPHQPKFRHDRVDR